MRLLGLWGPVAACLALIFYVSSMQMAPGAGTIPDWASHGGAYCVLGFLFCRALAGGLRPAPARLLVLGGLLATLYGISDEWHQMYVPNRVAEVGDVAKDLGGAALGAALFHLLAPLFAAQPRTGA